MIKKKKWPILRACEKIAPGGGIRLTEVLPKLLGTQRGTSGVTSKALNKIDSVFIYDILRTFGTYSDPS